MRVLVTDAIARAGIDYLRTRHCDVDEWLDAGAQALGEVLRGYDALITRSGTAVTGELLRHAGRLRIVGRAGVGVDNVDVDACSRRGIMVVNAPSGNVVSAAEHTIALLLALLRRVPDGHRLLKHGIWERSIYGTELYRKTVGVVGLGRVGSRVATRLRAFEADVIAYDPYVGETRACELGVRLTDLDALLRMSDVITVHVPLNDETAGMVAAKELARMRRGVYLVNCARGGIVNEAALLSALESGQVAGAAIDVWTEEPPASQGLRRLIEHPSVVVTPHLGANSREAQVNVALDIARQIVAFRDGDLPDHAVNIPSGHVREPGRLRPFVTLGDRLGRLCIQLDPGPLDRLEVSVGGAIVSEEPELIARAVIAGFLSPVVSRRVNLVNARAVAEERDLVVRTTIDGDTRGYQSLVTVTTTTVHARRVAAGTVFDGKPKIVRLRDLDIEFSPEGYVVILSYEDRPGVVGRIGSILGRLNVNIASMHVGRHAKRGRAVMVLILDDELTEDQLTEVGRTVEADMIRLVDLSRAMSP
jgi:D-3-phosphoglycerate dehydrogenase